MEGANLLNDQFGEVFAGREFLDFLPRYEFPSPAGQQRQELSRLILKLDEAAALAKLSRGKVQLERLKSDSRVLLLWRHGC